MHFLVITTLLLPLLAFAHPMKGRHGKRCRVPTSTSVIPVPAVTPETPATTWTTIWIETTISPDAAPSTTTSTTAPAADVAPTPTSSSTPIVLSTFISSPPAAATSTPAASSDTDASTISQYVSPQNNERTMYGASPLTWNNTLAAAAQDWANNCVFQHSGGTLGPYGENLSAGTGSFGIGAGIQLWLDEASSYDSSDPQPSHFTQVVWKSTTDVGCAVAVCDNIFSGSSTPANFYVCEYYPAGNVLGYFPENVGSSS